MELINMIVLQSGGGSFSEALAGMWPFFLIIIVSWFFFIRPQSKKHKEQMTFVQEMEKGDEVVTTSGILGRINKIEDNIITLQVDTKTFIRVTRAAISKELTADMYNKDDSKKS